MNTRNERMFEISLGINCFLLGAKQVNGLSFRKMRLFLRENK